MHPTDEQDEAGKTAAKHPRSDAAQRALYDMMSQLGHELGGAGPVRMVNVSVAFGMEPKSSKPLEDMHAVNGSGKMGDLDKKHPLDKRVPRDTSADARTSHDEDDDSEVH